MGFLDGIGELLGGFNAQRRIDTEGFDWREKAAQAEAARKQQQQEWQQGNEDWATKAATEADLGAAEGEDISSLIPQEVNRARVLARAKGAGLQAKSSLEDQKTYRDLTRQGMVGDQRMTLAELTGQQRRDLAELQAKLKANMPITAAEQARLDAYKQVAADRIAAMERRGSGSGSGGTGRPQLRLVSDGQGGTMYRWISPSEEGIAGPPTATQRETAGMAQNMDEVLGKMEELAPDVTQGPVMGRISEAWQSQYPSGKEAEFDQYVKQLVDLAYIKSGKQINKQELEMQLRGMISRSKGDLAGQVKRAKPYIENVLDPYRRSGAIKPDEKKPAALKPGDVYKGMRYKGGPKNSPSSWERP